MGKLLKFSARFLRRVKHPRCSMIVAAAGSSRRMGGTDKLTAPLAGKAVLQWTLLALEASSCVEEIILTASRENLPRFLELTAKLHLKKLRAVVVGGDTRTESVARALKHVSRSAALIGVHDGARPLAKPELIDAVIRSAAKYGAAAAALPMHDTVRLAEKDVVVGEVDRSRLRRMQTPQVFDAALFRAASAKAAEQPELFTDDVSAVQALGMSVRLVPGSETNLKLTTPEDLALAGLIMEAENAANRTGI